VTHIRVIAEAGVNHNGSIGRALEMVDAAADAGADAVKFQSFVPEALVAAGAPKAVYQEARTGPGSQLEMLASLRLDESAHRRLIERCSQRRIGFLSSPFDIESVEMLASLGVREFKIASGEITDLPVLRAIARSAETAILSTGMATLEEVSAALSALEAAGLPRNRITLLHCTTEYPAPFCDVNLRAMVTLGRVFDLPIGYSDHTQGTEVSIAAAAMGATLIEKHFTLDRTLPGPDHAASLEPEELKAMVSALRNVTAAMGAAEKMPTPAERRNMEVVRKSIVAAKAIGIGEVFSEANLTTKRPGSGMSPMLWDSVVGQRASRSYVPDELIEL
jgi:N,N'-diacetyllegionaminate synthase